MKNYLWLGTEASYDVVMRYEAKYQFDKEAFSRSPFDDLPTTDATFGVQTDRIGLYLLEKVGDTTVLKVHGSLVTNYSRWQQWFPGEATSYEAIKDALQIVMESGEKKVLMDFSTGGGAVRGLDTVTTLMAKVRKSGVKLDGHTDDACFSAGYWLAAGCRQFTASKMAEQGSIGTLAVVRTYANTEQTMGVKFTVLRAGEFKALGNPFEELTPEAKEYLQKNVEHTNSFFLEHVAQGRNLQMSDSKSWAEGRTFHTADAIKVGLVDKVATLDDLIGSGAAANKTSDNRRFEMKISAEKLAQIAAGAAPETVLNDAELKQYNADLEAADAAAKTGKTAEDGKDTGNGEGEDGGKGEGGEGTKEPEKDAKNAVTVSMADELKASIKENGKLEAKLEDLTAKLEAANTALTAAKAETQSLVVLGQAAVANLQTALRLPKEAKASPAEVLTQFNDLSSKMASTFKTGQQSKDTSVEDNTQASESGSWRFGAAGSNVTQLKTSR